jgi:hypothetical protein
MNKKYAAGLAIILGLSATGFSRAEDMKKAKPGVVEARAATVSGTVDSINYETRQVTLKTPKGEMLPLEIGPEVHRLKDVKKGDTVKIEYLESVAVMVADPHATIGSTEASGKVIVRNKTEKPSGMAVETHVATATVTKIDAKNRKATLKASDGHEFDVDVAPDVQHLENVKKGDQVLVKYTQSLGIAVSK